ncbi:diguanylate cyclase [Altererythrobacter xixiisoli]|uniref:diguanylate cyclase n=1 Tax=Croceibacterium xixiisoli TaxID=1476466 RepID=A0A6I4TX40_9SPHN|nr:GGDEF domain-containing protein [Croceibacterium xixiisoli]MXP00565.1 diguanylate cyclase [Croceibacterium xixiisoli]
MFGIGSDPEGDSPNVLTRIDEFLQLHGLAPSLGNIVRGFGIVTGSDAELSHKVRARLNQGAEITQEWFDSHDDLPPVPADPGGEYRQLAEDLERAVADFGRTTHSAQTAASNYGKDLARQVEQVDNLASTGSVMASLAHIARAMLDRTREVEEEIRRSEEEAKSLRKSLEKARREASIDHLTKLPNRRAFEDIFATEREDAAREVEPLFIALCDIDHFKRVNDDHGHATGDRVIRVVAQTLSGITDHCHVARIGGEEFVLLFRGMNAQATFDAIDHARAALAARHLVDKNTNRPIGTVTISAGITNVFDHPDMGTAMRAADTALYKAKETGRNRVEIG